MNRARFPIPDLPRDRPQVPEVVAMVRAYYARPENGAGGNCHVVLDDGNLGAGSLRFCLEWCEREGDSDGAAIMRAMMRMSGTQRRKVYRGKYGGPG